MHDAGSPPRRDTRARVQTVALELFAEQGYEKTSLREIAERLGVTKAALYYHFKSKEDIVRSFTEDYRAELDEVIGEPHCDLLAHTMTVPEWDQADGSSPRTKALCRTRTDDPFLTMEGSGFHGRSRTLSDGH